MTLTNQQTRFRVRDSSNSNSNSNSNSLSSLPLTSESLPQPKEYSLCTNENTDTCTNSNTTCNDEKKGSYIKYEYQTYNDFISSLQAQIPSLPANHPCRFLLSKGKQKSAQLSPYTVTLLPISSSTSMNGEGKEEREEERSINNDGIVDSDQRRTICYPKGSTYNIKTKYILPITKQKHIIIVASETKDYRKLCIVQTPSNHSFIEIGCDFALTIGNVQCKKRLGIDKSKSSLEIAHRNFPDLALEEVDVLEESDEMLMNLLERYGMNDYDDDDDDENDHNGSLSNSSGNKLIVGIDINGNREFEAVRDCLQRVLDLWQPRLVIVKSRSMYCAMMGHSSTSISGSSMSNGVADISSI